MEVFSVTRFGKSVKKTPLKPLQLVTCVLAEAQTYVLVEALTKILAKDLC